MDIALFVPYGESLVSGKNAVGVDFDGTTGKFAQTTLSDAIQPSVAKDS